MYLRYVVYHFKTHFLFCVSCTASLLPQLALCVERTQRDIKTLDFIECSATGTDTTCMCCIILIFQYFSLRHFNPRPHFNNFIYPFCTILIT